MVGELFFLINFFVFIIIYHGSHKLWERLLLLQGWKSFVPGVVFRPSKFALTDETGSRARSGVTTAAVFLELLVYKVGVEHINLFEINCSKIRMVICNDTFNSVG